MDNLCHTLVGAALGEAGLKDRTRYGNAILMIAANLPDVDVLAFATATPSVALRRGWTHGVLAQALLPVILTAIVVLWARRRPPAAGPPVRAAAVLVLALVGVLSHVGLDYLNNYGVRLLMPLSGRWFYGDAVFIVDPWMWLTLGIGVLVARRRRPAAALVALALVTLYIVAMLASARAARQSVGEQWMATRGRAPQSFMVGPVFANPFRRAVIVQDRDRYAIGTFEVMGRRLAVGRDDIPVLDRHPVVLRAQADPTLAAILVWSRFPAYRLQRVDGGTEVRLEDLRFGSRVGATTVFVPD